MDGAGETSDGVQVRVKVNTAAQEIVSEFGRAQKTYTFTHALGPDSDQKNRLGCCWSPRHRGHLAGAKRGIPFVWPKRVGETLHDARDPTGGGFSSTAIGGPVLENHSCKKVTGGLPSKSSSASTNRTASL